jgi:hypothetical protein
MLARDVEQVDTQVLSIRVTINFQRLTESSGLGENTWPVYFQARSIIIDAVTRMAENETSPALGPKLIEMATTCPLRPRTLRFSSRERRIVNFPPNCEAELLSFAISVLCFRNARSSIPSAIFNPLE